MGWRGLAVFWACALILAGAGAVTLQVLGPPASPPEPVAAAPQPPPQPSPQPAAQPSPAPAGPDGRIASPDPALLEMSRAFPGAALPRIAADGRAARVVYARRTDPSDTRPRIGLILAGVGLSEADSRAAIDAAPGAVTHAFSSYAPNPDALLAAARARGHEVLASIPMEPHGFPLNDAGAKSLLTGAEPAANRSNLEWALSRIQGYAGATGASDGLRGERFAEQTSSMLPVLEEIARRGLLYIDPRPGRTMPFPTGVAGRAVDLVVDDPPARAEIEAKLAALERLARERGSALGLAGPLRPVTVERIVAWARGLDERGFVLAPVSALVGPPAKAGPPP